MNAYGAQSQPGMPVRPGMTVPLPGHLNAHRDKLIELADMGYTDIWSAEADGADAFTPLALAAASPTDWHDPFPCLAHTSQARLRVQVELHQ